jgi:glycosyltransferase involved in cell wall biosynthesis
MVNAWGATAIIVQDVPINSPNPVLPLITTETSLFVICSFHTDDEPVIEIFKSAEKLPKIQFFVSGDHTRLPKSILELKPANIHFTGFISREEYTGYIARCDAVIALTNRDHTMQRGAYEAIYLGKPVITSNFPILKKSFYKGAVHVNPVSDDIVRGILEATARLDELTLEVKDLRDKKLKVWEENKLLLSSILDLS